MLIKKFFIIFLMFFSMNLCAKNLWTIKNIEFQGLRYFPKAEALRNILFNIGGKVSQNDIQKSIKSLFQTGKFEDIKVFFSKESLIFKVIERPLIYHISIVGNHIIKNSIFNQYLNQLGIEEGQHYNPYSKDIFIKNIKQFYYHSGRYQANVQLLTNFSSNNRVNLKILINEGNLLKINNIQIFGNKTFSRDKIISLLKLKDYKPWWNLLEKCIYYDDQLEEDIGNLTKFYLNRGYYNFHVKKIVNFLKDQNKVNIILKISEGSKYKINRFYINGNLLQYYDKIKNLININNKEFYNKEKIDLIVQKIKYFLSENGYINSQIIIDPKINSKNKTIILDFNVNINQRYFVNKICFKGNELTKDEVLRREIKQIEGEWFNSKLIDLGKESLEKINYIHDIKVTKNFLYNKSNAVNVTYELKESPTGTINFGLGYGKDSGLSFNASLSKDNLFGSGNSIKTSIIKNDNQKYVDLLLTYPYFLDNGTNLNTRLFYNDFQYHLNGVSTLVKQTSGFESDLSFLINDVNRANIGFGYTRNSLINKNSVTNHNNSVIDSKNKIVLLNSMNQTINDRFLKNSLVNDFTLNYSFLHNTLKNLYFPISGNQTYLSGKNTIPGSDDSFYKFLLDTEQYIPLDKEKKFIFLTHFKAGFGDSLNQEKLPFYENFHSNILNNVRGFRVNTIGPKKIDIMNNSKECFGYQHNNFCESLDSIGGNAMFMTNLELIVPIPFLKEEYKQFLRSSLFLDVGNIWDTRWKDQKNIHFTDFINLKNIYSSVGVSLQWFSPIGPLVFSYAHPMQKNENSQLEAFQFNIGKNW